MDALDIDKWRSVSDSPGTSVAVSSILIGLLMLGRAAFVFPLSFLSNLAKKNQRGKIDFKMQVVIWWSGLMRGAVSVALAYNKFTRAVQTDLRGNAIMITSTIEFAGNLNVARPDRIHGFLTRPTSTVHYYWRQFDDSFMRPVFGGRSFVPLVPGSPTERDPPTDLSSV